MSPIRSGTCIWCGHNRVDREDVIPKWIGETLQQLVPANEKRIHDIAPRSAIDIADWGKKPTRFKVKAIGRAVGPKRFIVCPTCNGGWMSVLEKRSKPVMAPLILGTPLPDGVELSDSDLATINTWMTKTAIVMDSAEDTPAGIPQAVRTTFYEHPEPMDYTRIWIAGYTPEYGHLVATST